MSQPSSQRSVVNHSRPDATTGATSPGDPTRAQPGGRLGRRRAGCGRDRAIEANPAVADKIRAGKVSAAGALIGAVMKQMRGQADAARARP